MQNISQKQNPLLAVGLGILIALSAMLLSACNPPNASTDANNEGGAVAENQLYEEPMEQGGSGNAEAEPVSETQPEGDQADQAASYQLNQMQPYNEALFLQAQADGRVVLLDFYAPWCPTCRANDPLLNAAVEDSEKEVAAFRVDYDTATDVKKAHGVTTQSTYIVFEGQTEVNRVVGSLNNKIESLF